MKEYKRIIYILAVIILETKDDSSLWDAIKTDFSIIPQLLSVVEQCSCQPRRVEVKDYCITERANVIFCAVGLR